MGGVDLCKLQFCLLPLVWSKNTCQATALDYCIWKKKSVFNMLVTHNFVLECLYNENIQVVEKWSQGGEVNGQKYITKNQIVGISDINVMWASAWEEPWTAAVLQVNSRGSSATPLTVMCVLQALLFGPLALCIHNQQCHVKLLHWKRNCLKISCKQQLII